MTVREFIDENGFRGKLVIHPKLGTSEFRGGFERRLGLVKIDKRGEISVKHVSKYRRRRARKAKYGYLYLTKDNFSSKDLLDFTVTDTKIYSNSEFLEDIRSLCVFVDDVELRGMLD